MLDTLSIVISALSVLAAALAVPGLDRVRLTIVITALGCGQIHLAVLAYGIFMVVESRWRFQPDLSNFAYFWLLLLLAGIGVTTTLVPVTSRTFTELAQLSVYIVLSLLTLNYLRTGECLYRFLFSSVVAATAVALLGLMALGLGLQSVPHIFVGRGSNEGGVFISLLGAVPAAALLVRSRNPAYALLILLFAYAQLMATARGSLVITGVAGLTAVFFLSRLFTVRAAMVLTGLYLLYSNLPFLSSVYEQNLNFSARERLALYEYGVWLWEQRMITGWGWGSTTDLARLASNTELVYPHFHHTYVQLLVEAGIVGWLIIGTFVVIVLNGTRAAFVRFRQPALSMLVIAGGLALAISGVFEAMLYGADRIMVVSIVLCLITRALKIAEEEFYERTTVFEVSGKLQPEHQS